MLPDDLAREAEQAMTVCNACRYCEAYCPMFAAMETRATFQTGDLTYLANLCHNCGECLYACPFAPPHEFAINVPRTMAQVRLASYEAHGWPNFLDALLRQRPLAAATILSAVSIGLLFAGVLAAEPDRLWRAEPGGDFYQVVPHSTMVALFGGVALFILLAIAISTRRFWREMKQQSSVVERSPASVRGVVRALADACTLRHLHPGGVDCTDALETRTPWRRWCHHLTFYGFLLCFASTSVAAIYHVVFGWRAPYGYASLPVMLGTAGGLGLVAGPAGLAALRLRRDESLHDPAQRGSDVSFIALLLLTSLTGLALLGLRETPAMPGLLIVHLGFVLALFLTLPYGKFVHGIDRVAALLKYANEEPRATEAPEEPSRR